MTKVSNKTKAELLAMDLKSQLMQVIHIHTPSEMRMVYMQVCGLLSFKPLTDFFFKSSEKRNTRLKGMIWENCKLFIHVWDEYVL